MPRHPHSDDERRHDDDPQDHWNQLDPDEEPFPLDDADLEIDDEPEPDERDFWLDPDESGDPWN